MFFVTQRFYGKLILAFIILLRFTFGDRKLVIRYPFLSNFFDTETI